MTVLVDSDILIEVLRRRDNVIAARWTELGRARSPITFTPITEAELWAGARPSEHEALDELFLNLLCIPLDREVGRLAGDYLRYFHKSHGVQLSDAFIAASAVLTDAHLWTRNRKHYPMPELSFY